MFTSIKHKNINWKACDLCKGQGTLRRKLQKKARLHYKKALELYNTTSVKGPPPLRPKGSLYPCPTCKGTGLTETKVAVVPNRTKYPHVSIIGAGIGGVALAIACLHRQIPFTLYERDYSFDARSQGYGLTLQQASKAIASLGIDTLHDGIVSTKHIVHDTTGKIIGEWGMRKWGAPSEKKGTKRTNIHIARQALRLKMLEQLGNQDNIQWGHQLLDYTQSKDDNVILHFKVNDSIKSYKTNLVVGADGIRSTLRQLLFGKKFMPLQYLDCMVILGICHLDALGAIDTPLLDNATVFQTSNGKDRMYMMPYAHDMIMWQFSFPIKEKEAQDLHLKGKKTLKLEAIRRTDWHSPIPQIVTATPEDFVSGYPVYDRALLTPKAFYNFKQITLIGDAAHPMSPFKGQGANQAILDALSLAKNISKGLSSVSTWQNVDMRKQILTGFETEMLTRSASKVKGSRTAVAILHSKAALDKGDHPRSAIKPKS